MELKQMWWIIPIALIIIFGLYKYTQPQNVYGFSYTYDFNCPEGICTRIMLDNSRPWPGSDFGIMVGVFQETYTSSRLPPYDWIVQNIQPQLNTLNANMAQKGIVADQSKCKIKVEGNTLTGTLKSYNLNVNCVLTDHTVDDGGVCIPMPNTDSCSWFCYMSPYYCRLDAPYTPHPTGPYWVDVTLLAAVNPTCNTAADTNCDGRVDRTELGAFITKWTGGQITRTDLGNAITIWARGGV